MNQVFEPRGYRLAADGTEVSPFLNATDANQRDVPWDAIGDVSITAGRMGAGVQSKIHVHPLVTQVTYVVSGRLTVRMKGRQDPSPYDLVVGPDQAVITRPETLLQLLNRGEQVATALYVVSPPYIREAEGDKVVYTDAVAFTESWEELARQGYDVPALRFVASQVAAARDAAVQRLRERKGRG